MIANIPLLAPDEIIERYAVIIGKLYRRPERYFPLAALVSLINGELHIQNRRYLPLRFVAVLAQIAYSFVNIHGVFSIFNQLVFGLFWFYYIKKHRKVLTNNTKRCYNVY